MHIFFIHAVYILLKRCRMPANPFKQTTEITIAQYGAIDLGYIWIPSPSCDAGDSRKLGRTTWTSGEENHMLRYDKTCAAWCLDMRI